MTAPRRPVTATLVVLAVMAVTAGCVGSDRAGADATEVVDRWQVRSGAPAVVVAIDAGDGTPWVHAAGTALRDGDQPVAADAPFRVASITKLFVATVVMQLVEEGAVGLDDPVHRHLPDAPVDDAATVRNLLGHTSGVPDHAAVPGLGAALLDDRDRRWTPAEVVDLVAALEPDFEPGTACGYSNTGYVILGQLIEAVTGRTWATEVRARIIDPLDLSDTTIPSHGDPPAEIPAGYHDADGDGHTEDVETGPWPALETEEGPAGAIVSTAIDVARATRAILAGDLLHPDTVEEMTTPGPFDRRYDGTGLGVEWARPDRQTLVVGHGGFLPGIRSVTWYVPASDAVVTVWANESRVDPTDLAELLLPLLDGPAM